MNSLNELRSTAVLLKVLLNSTLKLYVLLKDLFSKTEELGSFDFERGAKFLQGSLKRLFSEQYVRNSVDTHMH